MDMLIWIGLGVSACLVVWAMHLVLRCVCIMIIACSIVYGLYTYDLLPEPLQTHMMQIMESEGALAVMDFIASWRKT